MKVLGDYIVIYYIPTTLYFADVEKKKLRRSSKRFFECPPLVDEWFPMLCTQIQNITI